MSQISKQLSNVFYWKKSAYMWTSAAQSCAVPGSTVLLFPLAMICGHLWASESTWISRQKSQLPLPWLQADTPASAPTLPLPALSLYPQATRCRAWLNVGRTEGNLMVWQLPIWCLSHIWFLPSASPIQSGHFPHCSSTVLFSLYLRVFTPTLPLAQGTLHPFLLKGTLQKSSLCLKPPPPPESWQVGPSMTSRSDRRTPREGSQRSAPSAPPALPVNAQSKYFGFRVIQAIFVTTQLSHGAQRQLQTTWKWLSMAMFQQNFKDTEIWFVWNFHKSWNSLAFFKHL